MKSKVLVIFLILTMIMNSCEDDKPSFYFSFKCNNERISFSSHRAYDNFPSGYTWLVGANSEDLINSYGPKMDIIVKFDFKNAYTLDDSLTAQYLTTDDKLFRAPGMYVRAWINGEFILDTIIYETERTEFHLLLERYDTINNIVSGTFSGLMRMNGPYISDDSVVISDGRFNLRLEDIMKY